MFLMKMIKVNELILYSYGMKLKCVSIITVKVLEIKSLIKKFKKWDRI